MSVSVHNYAPEMLHSAVIIAIWYISGLKYIMNQELWAYHLNSHEWEEPIRLVLHEWQSMLIETFTTIWASFTYNFTTICTSFAGQEVSRRFYVNDDAYKPENK